MGIGNFVTRTAGKVSFAMSKHAPELWLATGIVSGVAATGFAIYSTTKARKVHIDHLTRMDIVHQKEKDLKLKAIGTVKEGEEVDVDSVVLPKDQRSEIGRQTLKEYTITVGHYAALYAPTIALTAISVTSVLVGHGMLRKRYMGVVAAYTALQTRFDEYKRKTVELYGEDADQKIEKSIAESHAIKLGGDSEDAEGEEEKSKLVYNSAGWSNIDRVFDETCWRYNDRNADWNRAFLVGTQKRLNAELADKGYVMLNRVYHELGFPKTKAGMVMGWLYEPEGKGANDITGEVSFGLIDDEEYRLQTISGDGYERSIPLHFCGAGFGLIYDKVPLADI